MVVVTSPMGVQAPPALAATTTMAPSSLRSSASGTARCSTDSMTIVVVRLSSMALRKKVSSPSPHSSRALLAPDAPPLALTAAASGLKPPCCKSAFRVGTV